MGFNSGFKGLIDNLLFTFTQRQKIASSLGCHMENVCSRSLNIHTYYSSHTHM